MEERGQVCVYMCAWGVERSGGTRTHTHIRPTSPPTLSSCSVWALSCAAVAAPTASVSCCMAKVSFS